MELENELKVWRARRDITQAQLAEAVKLSRQTIHSIERGKFVPSVLSALKIAAFFGTNVEAIFFARRDER
ncbi:MAG: helix-turn-helix transcriptional regulator [FCB group bacterium]|nr:helix-turn-helix transcriptional regulator [FCB group bacterium]MBL7028588.1 helix-turn-helix transcriptional regulator [Candidatus Neomarinimicrobiota bacterium]MBL7120807.1 helix-turn-helix transcriptional regulator [Candidatus Neomarinimicrobiota bacterium]